LNRSGHETINQAEIAIYPGLSIYVALQKDWMSSNNEDKKEVSPVKEKRFLT